MLTSYLKKIENNEVDSEFIIVSNRNLIVY